MNTSKIAGVLCVLSLLVVTPAGFGESVKDVLKGTEQQVKNGSDKVESVVKKGMRQNKATVKKVQPEPKRWSLKKIFKNPFKE